MLIESICYKVITVRQVYRMPEGGILFSDTIDREGIHEETDILLEKSKIYICENNAGHSFVSLFFLKGYAAFEKTGENYFHVFLNGNEIGTVGEADRAEQLLQEARRNIASQSDDMIFMDADLKLVGEEVLWGTLDNEDNLLAAMERELESSIRETSHRSYTMKVNEYMVNLSSVEDVESLLQAAVDKYDSEDKFSVELTHDAQKEFNVLTTEVVNKQELTAQEEQKEESIYAGGVQSVLDQAGSQADQQGEKISKTMILG